MVLRQLDIHMQNNEIWLILHHIQKDLIVWVKTIKKALWSWVWQWILRYGIKNTSCKREIWINWTSSKLKCFVLQNIVKKIKGQCREWKKIFANHTFVKRLVSSICKDLLWFSIFFCGCTHSMWKFPGQGLNPSCSWDLYHSCSNT